MSKTRVAILGLAIGSAVIAAFLAKGMIGKKPQVVTEEVSTVETVGVLVAAKNVQMGEKLVSGTMDWVKWPKKMVTEPMITEEEDPNARQELEKARARLAIYEGEPIMEKKLVLPTETGFMSAILPKGMRAISVRVSEETGAGGFILPNDRVDVILIRKIEGGDAANNRTVVSETVLTNVKVLAIDQTYRQAPEGENENVVVAKKTATLELDPHQSEVIAMAETAGTLSLSLRSIAENGDKGLDDGGPRLADKYLGGGSGSDLTVVKYGIQKKFSNVQ